MTALSKGDRGAITIVDLDESRESAWEDFVYNAADATFFHRAGWQRVIARAWGHRPRFRMAVRGREVVGILPLVEVRSMLFGHALISTAFCVYGGIAAVDQEAANALAADAAHLGETLGTDYVELRHSAPTPIGWPSRSDLYATFRRPLASGGPHEILKTLPAQKLSDIRRGIEARLRIRSAIDLNAFFRIYSEGVRNLGTPVFSRRFFAAIADEFADSMQIFFVYSRDEPVSTIMSYYFKDHVMPYFGGSLPVAYTVGADDYKYWILMCEAAERGCRTFDFGRSKTGTGSFDYKVHWGFRPQPLHYQYMMRDNASLPNINPLNPKYRHAIALWKRLPLPVANTIGPLVSRGLA